MLPSEVFLDLAGLDTYMKPYPGDGLRKFAHTTRANVKAHTGIPTCLGLAPTKTLAKLANRVAKKSPDLRGVLYLDSAERQAWVLEQVAVEDVWDIGHQ